MNNNIMLGFIYASIIIFAAIIATTLSDSRAIQSEIRDSLNVQNCYLMNNNHESFINCLNEY